MLNPPNSLSLLRAPLAFLFLSENLLVRTSALLLAMLTDCVDGYLARRYQYTSKLGAILDPMMDKFFVFFTLSIFIFEKKIFFWQALLMISRDLFLCLFAIYIIAKKDWRSYKFQAVRWGKITTAMQFSIILLHTFNIALPNFIYWIFSVVGFFMFIELIKLSKSTASQ
jgi:CDP-diacylglycerol--glycerol-3-phosphate 3-phosphatidyltransferase